MSITAKELAEKLGISASAVSIALNGKKGISDEKRDFILRAAKEYGLKRPLRKSFSSTFINLVTNVHLLKVQKRDLILLP